MGVTAVNLVRDMLKARPNSVALLVPAEITVSITLSKIFMS